MMLGVVGSRSINRYELVKQTIIHSPFTSSSSPEKWRITLVSGGADGVDTLAERFAKENNLDIEVLDANWDDWSNGHPAKYRNQRIVEESDAVIAIWNGHSNGTRDTIDKALNESVPIYVEIAP
jgi:hypothetical protein